MIKEILLLFMSLYTVCSEVALPEQVAIAATGE